MKKTIKLFKITILDSLKTNEFHMKFKNRFLLSFAVFIGALFIFIAVGQYAYMALDYLKPKGIQSLIFGGTAVIAIIAMFVTSAYKAKGQIFESKDNDLLFSMPISTSSILLNKIFHMMFFNYLISFFAYFPVAIAYNISTKVYSFYWLNVFLAFVFTPFIPTLFAAMFGYLIGYISSKFKNRSFIEAIISIGFLYIIINLFNVIRNVLFSADITYTELISDIKKKIYIIYLIMDSIAFGNILSTVVFISISIALVFLFVIIFKRLYLTINQKLSETFSKNYFVMPKIKTVNKKLSLFKKDFTLYTQSSVYLLNTFFGAASMLILAVISFYTDINQIISSIRISGINVTSFQILTIICTTVAAMACTTPSCISVEGKNLWIPRSLPIDEKDIFSSKFAMDYIIINPTIIISSIIMAINAKLSIFETIILAGTVCIMGINMSKLGMIYNLTFPKLKFRSEIQITKGSLAASMEVYTAIILLFINTIIYISLKNVISFKNFLSYLIIISIFISVILTKILNNWGIKKFKQLYC